MDLASAISPLVSGLEAVLELERSTIVSISLSAQAIRSGRPPFCATCRTTTAGLGLRKIS
jgi:hypothetical protein